MIAIKERKYYTKYFFREAYWVIIVGASALLALEAQDTYEFVQEEGKGGYLLWPLLLAGASLFFRILVAGIYDTKSSLLVVNYLMHKKIPWEISTASHWQRLL